MDVGRDPRTARPRAAATPAVHFARVVARRVVDTEPVRFRSESSSVVEVVSATVITLLSVIGIPASLAVSATTSVIGPGWGRATRATTLSDAASAAVRGEGIEGREPACTDPEAAGEPSRRESVARGAVPRIGEETPAEAMGPSELCDPAATGRVTGRWILRPSFSAALSYLRFRFVRVP